MFEEPEDTTGLAIIRDRHVPQPSNETTITTLKPKSRTTEWRKRKKEAAAAAASTSISTVPARFVQLGSSKTAQQREAVRRDKPCPI